MFSNRGPIHIGKTTTKVLYKFKPSPIVIIELVPIIMPDIEPIFIPMEVFIPIPAFPPEIESNSWWIDHSPL